LLREAELFLMAEQMLVEVLGRIRDEDLEIVLPPMYDAADLPVAVRHAVEAYVDDDARLPSLLGATLTAPPAAGFSLVRAERQAAVARVADAACAAAAASTDDDPATGDLLLRRTVERSLLAHYVAAYLGSTACPLPEELARPLWELTWPDADRWRAGGLFREPMPLPDHVSWRDRFLLCAGHLPHPLGH